MQTQEIQRADGSTVTAIVQTLGRAGSAIRTTRMSEPVVDLAGNVVDANISTLEHPGLCFVRKVEGQLHLTKHARDHGLVFYRDMCLGRLPGIDASPIHWRIYESLSRLAAKNQRPAAGALTEDQLWHPEVLRRKREAPHGVKLLDLKEMEAILEGLRDDDGDIEAAEAAAKKLGMEFTEGDDKATLRELLAEQKAAARDA